MGYSCGCTLFFQFSYTREETTMAKTNKIQKQIVMPPVTGKTDGKSVNQIIGEGFGV